MPDRFAGHASGLDAPAFDGFAAIASDTTDLPETTRALFVGGGGTLLAVMASGTEVSFTGVQAGSILPIRVKRIKATGTTATLLVGLV